MFHVEQFCLRCCIIGRLFVACPPSSDSFTAVPLSRTTSATVGTAGQTVRFNVDNGNKTSPWLAYIRLAYLLPKFWIATVGNAVSGWFNCQMMPNVSTVNETGTEWFWCYCSVTLASCIAAPAQYGHVLACLVRYGLASTSPKTVCAPVHIEAEFWQWQLALLVVLSIPIKKQRPSQESLCQFNGYSILNKNTYYRLNRMSAVAPFSS